MRAILPVRFFGSRIFFAHTGYKITSWIDREHLAEVLVARAPK